MVDCRYVGKRGEAGLHVIRYKVIDIRYEASHNDLSVTEYRADLGCPPLFLTTGRGMPEGH